METGMSGRTSIIANHANHAANERTFFAWTRTGPIGIAIIVRGGIGFERTRRAIDREGFTPMPQSPLELVRSAALLIAAPRALAQACLKHGNAAEVVSRHRHRFG
jgi:uncharacterized membrane protein YidH (DUF202 family)